MPEESASLLNATLSERPSISKNSMTISMTNNDLTDRRRGKEEELRELDDSDDSSSSNDELMQS